MKSHIMLIDDDKDELTFFLDALKNVPCEDGYKCTYAANPEQAVDMLKYLVPDFIFVDYQMTGMNGLQFLLAIKNQIGSEKPKVYLYSIFSNEKMKKIAVRLGAAGAMKKAYTIKALTEELRAVLVSPTVPAYVFTGGES